jgi:hypothetical protein
LVAFRTSTEAKGLMSGEFPAKDVRPKVGS